MGFMFDAGMLERSRVVEAALGHAQPQRRLPALKARLRAPPCSAEHAGLRHVTWSRRLPILCRIIAQLRPCRAESLADMVHDMMHGSLLVSMFQYR